MSRPVPAIRSAAGVVCALLCLSQDGAAADPVGGAGADPAPFVLWDPGVPFPRLATIPEPDLITHRVVHRAERGDAQFLLGAAMIMDAGTLFLSWGGSRVDENDDGTSLAGRRSTDRGLTWSPREIISAPPGNGEASSHGIFLADGGDLWAFAPRAAFVRGPAYYPRLRTEAYRLDRRSGRWEGRGAVMPEGFWPLGTACALPGGGRIIPGAIVPTVTPPGPAAAAPEPTALPAVAINRGPDILTVWEVVPLPLAASVATQRLWGETAIIVDGMRITAIARYGAQGRALAAESADAGRTWTPMRASNLPMATTKPCAGMLSTGQRYLICNLYEKDPANRDALAILVSRPGQTAFSAAFRIRHGRSPEPRMPGWAKQPQWAYPDAIEDGGQLFVAYAIAKEDCGLSIIPVSCLAAGGGR